ncbi:hypothetical protein ABZP36_001698 [Zizania latifolia]
MMASTISLPVLVYIATTVSLPIQGPPLGLNHRRALYLMNNPRVYPVDGHATFGTLNYNSRGINASMQRNNMRATLRKKLAQTCDPIACGAPFTICYNCSEVLQLPNKSPVPGKDEYKLRCGSCSHVLLVKLDGSGLDVSAPSPISLISAGSKNSLNDGQGDDIEIYHPTQVKQKECKAYRHLVAFLKTRTALQDLIRRGTDTLGSRDVHPEAEVVARVPSLPLRDHFGYSPSERVVDGSGKGSRSTRSEHEKAVLTDSFKQNTTKNVSVVGIMDLSDDEYEDPDYSQDPGDAAQSVDHPRATKTGMTTVLGSGV